METQNQTFSLSSAIKSKLPHSKERIKLEDLKLNTAEIFEERTVIGEGTFGKVYKAKIKSDTN